MRGTFQQHEQTLILSSSLYRFAAIHAEAPEFMEMSVEQEILVTGIKVVDLLAPYAKGGKIGMLLVVHIFQT